MTISERIENMLLNLDYGEREVFLEGACELLAYKLHLLNDADFIFINDDKQGADIVSLYHALVEKEGKYYDINGCVAKNEVELRDYIETYYSMGNKDYTIYTGEEAIKRFNVMHFFSSFDVYIENMLDELYECDESKNKFRAIEVLSSEKE